MGSNSTQDLLVFLFFKHVAEMQAKVDFIRTFALLRMSSSKPCYGK